MPVLRLNNLAVDTIDTGPPAGRADAEPVLLLHSAGMGANQWRGLIELLRAEHRLVAPNLRGYGRSEPWPKDTAADLDAESAMVEALIAEVAGAAPGGRVHLVGHSLGAHVALLAASGNQARLGSLFLIEPIALGVLRDTKRTAALEEVGAMVTACIAAFDEGDVNAAMTHFVDYWEGPGAWDAIPKAQRLFIYARAEKMHQDLRAVWADRRPLAAYRDITVPAQVVIGGRTTNAARQMAQEIHRALPGARYTEVPSAGHMLPVSHPEALAPLVEEHLRRNATR